MKRLTPFIIAAGIFLGSFGIAVAVTVFNSNQVGTSPQNGYVLQTDGTVSTWVANSGGASYPFPLSGNATSTLTQFNGGITSYASTTIGDGTGRGGLTISGAATTTGNAYVVGNVGIGTSTLSAGSLLTLGAQAGELTSVNDAITINSVGRASLILNSDTPNTVGEFGGAYVRFNQDGAGSTQGIVGTTQGNNTDPSGAALTGAIGNATILAANSTSALIQFGVAGQVIQTMTFSGSTGFGTTTPYATLALAAVPANVNSLGNLFVISSSTAAFATTTLLSIDNNGYELLKTEATTSQAAFYIQGTGATFTTTAAGDYVGVNAPSTFTGSLLDLRQAGTQRFNVSAAGTVNANTLANLSSSNNASISLATTGFTFSRNVADANPAVIIQQVNSGSSGDILQVKNSALTAFTVTQGGNVGISSTTPSSKFAMSLNSGEVYSSGNAFVISSTTAANATSTLFSVSNTGVVTAVGIGNTFGAGSSGINNTFNGGTTRFLRAAVSDFSIILSSGFTSLLGAANQQLALGANSTEAMRFTLANNVGVGTTTPFGKFAISLQAADTAYPNNNAFIIASSTSLATTTLFAIDNIGSTTLGRFGACSGTSALTTNSSGVIVCGTITGTGGSSSDPFTHAVANQSATTSAMGIGTTTPWAQLSVATSTQSSPLTNLFEVASTTGASLFKVLGSGLIGIGSSTPFARLSISGGAIVVAQASPATSTNMTVDCSSNSGSNTVYVPIGTASVTLTLSSLIGGHRCFVAVVNPNAVAGAITWAAAAGQVLYWPSGVVPSQTTTANKGDGWSFTAIEMPATATSTPGIKIWGAQSPNF